MQKELLIDVQDEQVLLAVVENNTLVEIFVERELNYRIVGNIYLGIVKNVLPGMQAAFVDIGLEKNAFLYFEDAAPFNSVDMGRKIGAKAIGDLLKEGQPIMVQVTKEPVGSKGARVTTNITLPGRYVVLMPFGDHIGVSRRIENETERERLKEIAVQIKPEGTGMIVRTIAMGASESELRQDLDNLQKQWIKIRDHYQKNKPCSILYKDLSLIDRMTRDLLDEKVSRIIVNNREVKEQILETMHWLGFHVRQKVSYEPGDIFETHSILQQLEQGFNKRVWLKSGAYIVIDQTEALTVIDVNTGKYIGKDNLQATVLHTNLQAAEEIVRQLRLRNIGGIIVIDFIDMERASDQETVLEKLESELKKDRVKTSIMGITSLGLVEMTRKKARMGLESQMMEECPYCRGRGKLLSPETVALNAKRSIRNKAQLLLQDALLVTANPLVAAQIIGTGGASIKKLEESTGKRIIIKGDSLFHQEKIEIRSISAAELETYQPVKEGEIITVTVEDIQNGASPDGVSRIHGYVISIIDGAQYIGEEVQVKIIHVYRTYARAEIVDIDGLI